MRKVITPSAKQHLVSGSLRTRLLCYLKDPPCSSLLSLPNRCMHLTDATTSELTLAGTLAFALDPNEVGKPLESCLVVTRHTRAKIGVRYTEGVCTHRWSCVCYGIANGGCHEVMDLSLHCKLRYKVGDSPRLPCSSLSTILAALQTSVRSVYKHCRRTFVVLPKNGCPSYGPALCLLLLNLLSCFCHPLIHRSRVVVFGWHHAPD